MRCVAPCISNQLVEWFFYSIMWYWMRIVGVSFFCLFFFSMLLSIVLLKTIVTYLLIWLLLLPRIYRNRRLSGLSIHSQYSYANCLRSLPLISRDCVEHLRFVCCTRLQFGLFLVVWILLLFLLFFVLLSAQLSYDFRSCGFTVVAYTIYTFAQNDFKCSFCLKMFIFYSNF